MDAMVWLSIDIGQCRFFITELFSIYISILLFFLETRTYQTHVSTIQNMMNLCIQAVLPSAPSPSLSSIPASSRPMAMTSSLTPATDTLTAITSSTLVFTRYNKKQTTFIGCDQFSSVDDAKINEEEKIIRNSDRGTFPYLCYCALDRLSAHA